MNNKCQNLLKGEDIDKYIKAQKINRWKYPNRMYEIKLVKKFTVWNPVGIRTKGRPQEQTARRSDRGFKYIRTENLEPNKLELKDRKASNDLVQNTRTHVDNKDIQIPSKYNKIYYTLPLLNYMFRLLRVIIRPSSELIQKYLIPSALWDPIVH